MEHSDIEENINIYVYSRNTDVLYAVVPHPAWHNHIAKQGGACQWLII